MDVKARIDTRKRRIKKRRRIRLALLLLLLIICISGTGTLIYYNNSSESKKNIIQAPEASNKPEIDNVSVENSSDSSQKDNSKNKVIATSKNADTEKKANDVVYQNILKTNSSSFDSFKIQELLSRNVKISDEKKIAFLTFDDGPSTTVTPKVLEILKNNNVKATFFVLGNKIEETPAAKNIIREIYKQGHAIGNHTYSHNYSKLYPGGVADANEIMGEIERTNDILRGILGSDFKTRAIRFPGGHGSWKGMDNIDNQLVDKGYNYIDWNALVGDAEGGGAKSRDQLISRYNHTFVGQEKVIILMHDTYGKKSTAEALQYIITDLKNKGYEFRTLI